MDSNTTNTSPANPPIFWEWAGQTTTATNTNSVVEVALPFHRPADFDEAADRLIEADPPAPPPAGRPDDKTIRDIAQKKYGMQGHAGGPQKPRKYAVVVRMIFDPARNPRLRATDAGNVRDTLANNAAARNGKYTSSAKKGTYHSWMFEFDSEEAAREFARENKEVVVTIEGVPYDVSLDADAFEGPEIK